MILKSVILVRIFLLLSIVATSFNALASENYSDHEAFCLQQPKTHCLTYIETRLNEVKDNPAQWYKIKTYQFDYYYDYQQFENLLNAITPFLEQDKLPDVFKLQMYFYYAKALNYIGKKAEAKTYAAKAFTQLDGIYNAFGDPLRLVELANLHYVFGSKKAAMRLLRDAEQRFAKNNDPIFHLELHINKAHIYLKWQQYEHAVKSNLMAYNAIKNTNHAAKIVLASGNLAYSYQQNKEYLQAINYYKTAFKFTEPSSIYHAIYSLRLAQVYLQIGKKAQAKEWLSRIDRNATEFGKGHAALYSKLQHALSNN